MKSENEIKLMRAEAYNQYLENDRLLRVEIERPIDPEAELSIAIQSRNAGQRAARLRGLAAERIATLDEVLGIESEFTRLIKLRNQ